MNMFYKARCWNQSWIAPLYILLYLFLGSIQSASSTIKGNNGESSATPYKPKRICLIPATYPWTLGPYQAQLYELSLYLSNVMINVEGNFGFPSSVPKYDVFWMPRTTHAVLPGPALYKSNSNVTAPSNLKPQSFDVANATPYSLCHALRKHTNVIQPDLASFPMDHITFLGTSHLNQHTNGALFHKNAVSSNLLHALALTYELDIVLTLMDTHNFIPNGDLIDVDSMPLTIGWIPYHGPAALNEEDGEGVKDAVLQKSWRSVLRGGSGTDLWVLRKYHGVAALCPSARDTIANALHWSFKSGETTTTTRSPTTTAVSYIPHVIDRPRLESLARDGSERVKTMMPDTVDEDTFVVLLQGGNYDSHDRKGWDTSIQAFVRFVETLRERDSNKTVHGQPNVHLYLHSLESTVIEAEMNSNDIPPPAVLPEGVNLAKLLHHSTLHQMPPLYTLDPRNHQSQIYTSLKSSANVCLHPSKVEGFGLNVLECQALGIPVITTNWTAMGDFTKLGVSVNPLQTMLSGGLYEMALPSVEGITTALLGLYDEHIQRVNEAAKEHSSAKQTREWIDAEFSRATVGMRFEQLVTSTSRVREARIEQSAAWFANAEDTDTNRPFDGSAYPKIYQTLSTFDIEHDTYTGIIDWDVPWTLILGDTTPMPSSNDKGNVNVNVNVNVELDWNADGIHHFSWKLLKEEYQAVARAADSRNVNAVMDGTVSVAVIPPVYLRSNGEPVPVPVLNPDRSPHPKLSFLVRTHMLTSTQGRTTRKSSIVMLLLQHAESLGQIKKLPDGLVVQKEIILKEDRNSCHDDGSGTEECLYR